MNGVNQMSPEAYANLEAEIERLETVERPVIAEKIGEARSEGDLSENAEYHAARNEQSFLETRIQYLRSQLQNATIVESGQEGPEIGFGSTFTLLDVESGRETTYTIVSSFEQDVSSGRLSSSSPVAEAVTGKRPGDVVSVDLPNGAKREFKVLSLD